MLKELHICQHFLTKLRQGSSRGTGYDKLYANMLLCQHKHKDEMFSHLTLHRLWHELLTLFET